MTKAAAQSRKARTKRHLQASNGRAISSQVDATKFGLERWAGYLLRVRGLSPETVRRYRALVERLVLSTGVSSPSDLTRTEIEAHIEHLYLAGCGRSVIAGVVAAARSWCEHLVDHGLLEASPAARLRGPRSYRREAPVLTVPEVRLLLYGPSGRPALPSEPVACRDRMVLILAYAAGLRAGDVGRLTLEDVGWREGNPPAASLLIRAGKWSQADVRVELGIDESRLLAVYLESARPRLGGGAALFPAQVARGGRGLSRWAVGDILEARVAEVGIEARGRALSPHILRHSIATHLLDQGWTLRDVQAHMRHRHITTTERYLHTTPDKIRRNWRRRHPLKRVTKGDLVNELAAALSPHSP